MNCIYGSGVIESVSIMAESKQVKNVSVTIRVEEEVYLLLYKLFKEDRRSGVSEVARLLLLRGVELYKRDRLLFEPSAPTPDQPSKEKRRSV